MAAAAETARGAHRSRPAACYYSGVSHVQKDKRRSILLTPAEDLIRPFLMFVALMTFVGCQRIDPLGPQFIQEFSVFAGCGDVSFYAVDPDDELMLTFRADGLVAKARAAAEETVTVFDLSTAAAQVVLHQGTRISAGMCNDVIGNGGPQVTRTWAATAGTATATIRPEAGLETARADLVLENVVLESGNGRVTFKRLDWMSVLVGWYAG